MLNNFCFKFILIYLVVPPSTIAKNRCRKLIVHLDNQAKNRRRRLIVNLNNQAKNRGRRLIVNLNNQETIRHLFSNFSLMIV